MPRIKIEEKHTYSHLDVALLGNIRSANIVAPFGTFRWHEPAYPVQGSAEDERIGRKIQTTDILVEGYITLDNTPISTVPATGYPSLLYYWNGYIQQLLTVLPADNFEWNIDFNNLTMPIRHMVVEFYDDDFRDSHMKPSEFINFIDYNIHNLNVKGGSVRNLYSTIIITSVQRLDCIYLNMANDEPRQQWERRIKVIDLYQD